MERNSGMRKSLVQNLILSSLLASTVGFQAPQIVRAEMPKPIIAINTDVEGENPEKSAINSQYVDAIRKAGGIPILLPPMSSDDLSTLMPNIDGVMMIGGLDYPPTLYKQEQDKSVSLMSPRRSDFDIILAKSVLADNTMPFLGICAGCQAMNIAAGGSLLQDIPSMKPDSKIKHASPHGWKNGFNKHQVDFEKDSKLAKAFQKNSLEVVTSHHQCVDKPADGFTVIAKTSDGVTEAIEKTGERFVLGVQWHPERDFEGNQKLFEELVRQASKRHSARLPK